MAALVFPTLDASDSARRAKVLNALRLDGKTLDANVAQAIQQITFERTIEGASTVTLTLIDPDGDLLDSGLFNAAVDIELPAPADVTKGLPGPEALLGFTLVRIKMGIATLILEFEDREVRLLRSHRRPLRMSRNDVTRAEFIRAMVREVKAERIRFWSPELAIRQPIQGVRQIKTKPVKQSQREPGFGAAKITVKGVEATNSQRTILTDGLDTARSMKANRRVMVGLVEAFTQESVVQNDIGRRVATGGNPGGAEHMEDVGVLHQNSLYWPATRDVPKDSRPFLKRLIQVEKTHKAKSIGWCVDQVQRSYTVNTAKQGTDYDQHQTEAERTVDAYQGTDPDVERTRQATEYRKRYLFRRGEPGGQRETSWAASGRLAAEVNFRRFVDYGVFHYVSDDYLIRAAARMVLDRKDLPDGVTNVAVGDFDVGKPKEMRDGRATGGAEVTVDVLADVLDPAIGGVWIVRGYGPCDGRYLVTRVRGSYMAPVVTVTLNLPVPKLPEPAPDIGQRTKIDKPAKRRANIEVDIGHAWGGTKSIFTQVVTPFMEQHGLRAGSAKRSTQKTDSGNNSDHWTGSKQSYATDYPTNDGEAIARAFAQSIGISGWKANSYTRYEVTFGGLVTSVQILWGAAIDHDDHIHVGIRAIRRVTVPTKPEFNTGDPLGLWHPDAVRVKFEDAGTFTGGGWKIVHHTTEGATIAAAEGAYRANRSAPHFTYDHDSGVLHQHIPLNRAARSLKHPSGPETNRARAIQIEHVGFTSSAARVAAGAPTGTFIGNWSPTDYTNIGLLCRWIEGVTGARRQTSVSFLLPATRLSGQAFYDYNGHIGHMHVPGNDHTDPAGLDIAAILA